MHEHDDENEEKEEDDNENEKSPDKPEDEDRDMQGEMFPESDTNTNDELETRREAHRNTRKCVYEETGDNEVTKADRSHRSHLLKIR